jgi:hypothetical protein
MELSRKDRIAKFAEESKSSMKKKVLGVTLAAGLLFGGTGAYAALNPEFLSQITNFANSVFGTKNTEITNTANGKQTDTVSDLSAFLTDLKTRIQNEINSWGEQEKTRVTKEIEDHNTDLQTQADTQASTDITNKKDALTETADKEILDANAALDAKYNELFPPATAGE